MISSEVLEYLRALIQAETTFKTHSMDASRDDFPRIVITPAYAVHRDRPMSNDLTQVEQDIRLTSAGASAEAMLDLATSARQCLSPGQGTRQHTGLAGWTFFTWFVRTEVTEVDRNITLTATGGHPQYTVEAFHVSGYRTAP